MAKCRFNDDEDEAYLKLCSDHLRGYVANTTRKGTPNYVVLHKPSCKYINSDRNRGESPGVFTGRGYSKMCADSLAELTEHVREKIPEAKPFSKECRCVDRERRQVLSGDPQVSM